MGCLAHEQTWRNKQNSSDQKKIDGQVKMSAMTAYQIITV